MNAPHDVVRAPVKRLVLGPEMVVMGTKGTFCGLVLVRRHAFDGEDFGGDLVLGGTLLSGLGCFLVAHFRPCCRTSAQGAAATVTEVVSVLVLEDMDLPAKEMDFLLLFAESNGHAVVELPQARSVSSGVGRRNTTINGGDGGSGDGAQVRRCFGGNVSFG